MPPLDLPVRVVGRPIKPLAFGYALASVYLTWLNAFHAGVLGSPWSEVFSAVWAACAVVLVLGWWLRSQAVAEAGLILVFFAFTARFAISGLAYSWDLSREGIYMSLFWAITAGGAYVLERADNGTRERD